MENSYPRTKNLSEYEISLEHDRSAFTQLYDQILFDEKIQIDLREDLERIFKDIKDMQTSINQITIEEEKNTLLNTASELLVRHTELENQSRRFTGVHESLADLSKYFSEFQSRITGFLTTINEKTQQTTEIHNELFREQTMAERLDEEIRQIREEQSSLEIASVLQKDSIKTSKEDLNRILKANESLKIRISEKVELRERLGDEEFKMKSASDRKKHSAPRQSSPTDLTPKRRLDMGAAKETQLLRPSPRAPRPLLLFLLFSLLLFCAFFLISIHSS